MGKATQLDEQLAARPLTAAEIKAREAAAEIGDADLEPTLSGTLEKPRTKVEQPRPVVRAPQRSWD